MNSADLMITKEREQNRLLHYQQWWYDGNTPVPFPDRSVATYQKRALPYSVKRLYERISYGISHGKQYNNCYHVKETSRMIPNTRTGNLVTGVHPEYPDKSYPYETSSPGGHVVNDMSHAHQELGIVGAQMWHGTSAEPAPIPVDLEPIDVEVLLASAMSDIVPKIKTEVSLLNFLVELRDVKELVAGPLRSLRTLRTKLKKTSKLTLKDLSKEAASGHLNYAFGFVPLQSDLLKMVDIIYDTRTKLKDFWDNQNKVLVSHWTNGTVEQFTDGETLGTWAVDGPYWKYPHRTMDCSWASHKSRTFTVTVKYQYEIRDAVGQVVQKDLAILGAYLDAFNLAWNPKILWDSVPFTFVVDWFLNVGNWLENFGSRNLVPSVTVHDACYSIKTRASSVYSLKSWWPLNGYNHQTGDCTLVVGNTIYERRRFCPRPQWLHGDVPLEAKLPTLKQFVLGASLLIANI